MKTDTVTESTQTKLKPARRLPSGISSRNRCFEKYRYGARQREITFELTNDDMQKLFEADCHYCGSPPRPYQYPGANGPYHCNGIDRKDPAGPYALDNCVTACKRCNLSKSAMTYRQFIDAVHRIATHVNARVAS